MAEEKDIGAVPAPAPEQARQLEEAAKVATADAVPMTAVADDAALEHGDDSAAKLADLDFEYQAAANAAGRDEKTYGAFGFIWRITEWYHSKIVPHTVNKKTYLILLVLLGWIGGHRWYEHRWYLAAAYTLFFWTGIPLAMCVVDAMIILPKKADENGCVVL